MFIRTSAAVLALIGALSTFVAPVEAAARIMPLGDSITGSPVRRPNPPPPHLLHPY